MSTTETMAERREGVLLDKRNNEASCVRMFIVVMLPVLICVCMNVCDHVACMQIYVWLKMLQSILM